jgi:hypothetical protein
MFKPSRSGNESVIWGEEEVMREFHVSRPEQVIDILALMATLQIISPVPPE